MDSLMTQKDVAEVLGYKNAVTFSSVRNQYPDRFPKPDRYIGKSPRWYQSTIEAYIKAESNQA